jgi:hypothetical protein
MACTLVWLFAGGLKRNEARTPNSSHFVWSSFVRSQKPVIKHRGSPMKLANKVAWITAHRRDPTPERPPV